MGIRRVLRNRAGLAAMLLAAAFAVGGFFAGNWSASYTDRGLRSQMLEQAVSLSRTINPYAVNRLSFTPADTANPVYERLTSQLQTFGSVSDSRGIWTMALRNGSLVFGPESYLEGDPLGEGHPGTVYENPPPEDFLVFDTAKPIVIGPYTDEYGTFVSASAPVIDPSSGEVILVVGVDMEAEYWAKRINRTRLNAILLFLVPAVFLILTAAAIRKRHQNPAAGSCLLKNAEAVAVLAVGISVTMILVLGVKLLTEGSGKSDFSRTAESHASLVRSSFFHSRSSILGSLARFYENSTFVDGDEFESFTLPLLEHGGINALAWIPLVEENRYDDYRALALSEGIPAPPSAVPGAVFPVWRLSADGAETLAPGEDSGRNELFRSAMEESRDTGLTTLSHFFTLSDGHMGAVAFLWAENPAGDEFSKAGFAAAELSIQGHLLPSEAYSAHGSPQCDLRLVHLSQGSPPLIAGCTEEIHESGVLPPEYLCRSSEELCSIHPLFVFGEAFAMVIRPGSDYPADRGIWLVWLTMGAGLSLTGFLALLTFSQIRRRSALETQVRARTAELSESEEKYRLIAENMADVISVTDLCLKPSYVSPSAAALTGYSIEELMDVPPGSIIDPEYLTLLRETVKEKTSEWNSSEDKKGNSFSLEMRLIRKNGEERWVDATVSQVHHGGGETETLIAAVRDITDKKMTELALREEHAQVMSIFDSIDQAIYISDMNTFEILFVNRTLRTMLGLDPLGCKCYEALQNRSSPCPFCTNSIIRSMGDGAHSWEYENPHLKRTFQLTDRVIRWPDGRDVRFELAVDITDLKTAQAQKAEMEAQLHQIQKLEAVGRLAGGIAHDFNNMLGVIMGHCEFAMNSPEKTDELKTHLEEIRRAGSRSAELVSQLLAFARKQSINPSLVDLNSAIAEMLGMLRQLLGEDISLYWSPCPNIWAVRIDPVQLSQILVNLVVNSRDAIQGGGIVSVETANRTADEEYCRNHQGFVPGEYATFSVTDDGPGMSPETEQHIFEPFFTTKGLGKGTGLGLATVYGIVKQNGGLINFYTEEGNGTTFRIHLPRQSGEVSIRTEGEATGESRGGTETILLVEDEPSLLELGCAMLESLGYTVIPAGSPPKAIELFRNDPGRVNLVMTDMVMPIMNGIELCKKLKEITPDIRTLFMSGYTADAITHRGILDTGIHFLQKPFLTSELAVALRKALEDRSP